MPSIQKMVSGPLFPGYQDVSVSAADIGDMIINMLFRSSER